MAINAEHKSKFQALYCFRFSLQINEKFSIGTTNHKQSNIIINNYDLDLDLEIRVNMIYRQFWIQIIWDKVKNNTIR